MANGTKPAPPLVIAHRGECLEATENSVAAIRAAAQAGADWVEVDVRLTGDGVAILAHDDQVGTLKVETSSLEVLREAEPDLATLQEALQQALGGRGEASSPAGATSALGVDLEIKGPVSDPARVAGVVSEATASWEGPLLISSFWPDLVEVVGAAVGRGMRGVLTGPEYDPDGATALEAARERRWAVALPFESAVSAALVDQAHLMGLKLITWTVNDPARMLELASWGTDGLITDDPALARRVLG